MEQYEYKRVQFAKTMTEFELNDLGTDGWELVCYVSESNSFVFKRPLI